MSNNILNHNPNQSSVDWLIGEIMKHQITFYGTSAMPLRIIEQAKEMHKDEIINAVNSCGYIGGATDEETEQYYNETFGQ